MTLYGWSVNFFALDMGVNITRIDNVPMEDFIEFVTTCGTGAHVKALSPVAALLRAQRMISDHRRNAAVATVAKDTEDFDECC